MEVRVEHFLTSSSPEVPSDRVAVRVPSVIDELLCRDQQILRSDPLITSQRKGGYPMGEGNDHATSRENVLRKSKTQ
jgi:hypothetical protein